MSDSSVFAWLCELRHSAETYEHGVRPLSGCGDLAAAVFRKREEEMATVGEKPSDHHLEIRHADICRVSVEFQDCVEQGQEEDLVEAVTVDNFEVYVTKDVLHWLSNLWYISEDEDDESLLQEFTSALENYQERNARTPRFPVEDVEQDIELRHHDRRRSPRSQTLHIMPEAAELGTFGQKSEGKDAIEIRSPKWSYDGQNRERVPLMRFQDGELTAIKEKAPPELIASALQISKRTPKKLELTDPDKKVYVIKSESIRQSAETATRRERSNSLTEKPVEKKKNILQKLLKRRSNRDLLERKGILMNEEIFGNTLNKLYEKSRNVVPVFVKNTIALIETDRNVRSEHIYRIPGNLATIQKIRVNVDRNNIKILEEYRNDPDVLTGALKLFFRELKEPLIPYRSFEQFLKILDKPEEPGHTKLVRNVVEKMECPHRETLETLIEHLLRVEAHGDDNKMNVHSLSIVWGPSILWPTDYTKDNAYDFSMIVNKVIELILNSYKSSRQSEGAARNEYSTRRASDRELNSIREEADATTAREETVKSSPKLRLKQQIIGFVRSDSKDKAYGNSLNLPSSSFDVENDLKPRKDAFGYRLEAMPKKENTNIPELIHKVTAQIERHAHVEGIYTQGGDKEKVSKLRRKIRPELQRTDVHDLITWLKTILQELEEPLLPPNVIEEFLEHYGKLDDLGKQRQVSASLANLKPAHRETVEHLAHHLLKILACKEKNKLNEQTISIIWAPLFYPPIEKSNKDDLVKYLDFVVVLLRIHTKKIEVTSGEECGKLFKHNIKFASVVKVATTHKKKDEEGEATYYRRRDAEDLKAESDSKTTIEMLSEKFKDIEIKKRNSEEYAAAKDSNKITLGTVAEKLKDIMKSEKKTTEKYQKQPVSYYENVTAEMYREMDRSD